MAAQMEHIHMQTQIGGVHGNVSMVGVPVLLNVVDPNGNYIDIATVTSDGYSGTFGYVWKSTVQGEYVITATFIGDESYGSSFATTYLFVDGSNATNGASTNNTVIYTIIGATIAMMVVMIVCFLLFRKK